MKIDIDKLKGHYQFEHGSCMASMIEAVCKLENIIPRNDFRFQNDKQYWESHMWVDGLTVSNKEKTRHIKFKMHFNQPRGDDWVRANKKEFYGLIDSLIDKSHIIISMRAGADVLHPEIITTPIKERAYNTFTYHADRKEPYSFEQDLEDKVMKNWKGTILFTYEITETEG